MRDLDKALADILAIPSQLAAGTAFRGYGPAAVAATSGIALAHRDPAISVAQRSDRTACGFFAGWAAAAPLSAALIWIEMLARTRRHHSGLADAMIRQAIEQFLPLALPACCWDHAVEVRAGNAVDVAGPVAGAGEPWHIRFGPLIAAQHRFRRRLVFLSGFTVLLLASQNQLLSPWTMGLPFAAGQLLMAALLYFASGENDVED